MEYECTPEEELLSRTLRFQKLLQKLNVEGALISQNVDLFYFAGTIQPSYLFVPSNGEPVLAVQENLARASQESKIRQIISLKNSHQLSRVLSDRNISVSGKIGLEMDVLPVNRYFTLCQDFPNANFVDISNAVKKVRMVKSEYEISHIRKAAGILKQVMEEAQRSIRPGMTELEVDANLGALARKLGHQGRLRMRGYNQEMFNGYVFSGKTGAVPTFLKGPLGGMGTTPAIAQGASFNKITENEPLIVDFGVGINGYVTDMTRTFVIGKLPENLLRAYTFLKNVKYFIEQRVKPGRSCSQLYNEIISLVDQEGYRDYFMGYKDHQMPFVGHGIGLEINEYPIITAGSNDEFQENMVFAFEPKLVFPNVGAVGVEDDYRVTGDGVEQLTDFNDQVLIIDYPPTHNQ